MRYATLISRILLASASLALPATVAAAPPIAYAKESGSSFDIYLANPNGTGAVKLYSTPANNSAILDLRPGDNELAIAESRGNGFKIIRHTDAGVRTSITPFVDSCRVNTLDYHPYDGSLLVIRNCLNPQLVEIRVWANGAYGPPLLSTDGMNDSYRAVRWLGDGSGFLLVYATWSGATLQRHSLSNPSAPTPIKFWSGASNGPSGLDTARCQGQPLGSACSKILYDDASGIHELRFDEFGEVSDTLVIPGATNGRYSPDNSRILYRSQVRAGYTLNVTNPAQTTATKGGYMSPDWRP